MKKILAYLFLLVSLPAVGDPVAATNDILVGINYFSGWWEELPNRWHSHGWTTNEPDWRKQFPERVPLLGCYNGQKTMDREIVAAATHGVDFFAFLWYFAPADNKDAAQIPLLNRGQFNFRNSTNAPMMKFMLEYCNHAELNAITDAEWNACVTEWVAAMRHPSYLRVGGKLVFKLHDAYQFWLKNDRDVPRCRARLETLRQAARAAGLGEMIIGGGIMSGNQVLPDQFVAKIFDFTATYMTVPTVAPRTEEYPYATLVAGMRAARVRHANDPIPWMPYLGAGWNPRPWTHPEAAEHHRSFFTFPTRTEWCDELRAMRDDFNRYPGLGLPLPNGGRQKIFTIYAWNEFGEGGIVAPTQGDGMMKLEGIKEVFRKTEVTGVTGSANGKFCL